MKKLYCSVAFLSLLLFLMACSTTRKGAGSNASAWYLFEDTAHSKGSYGYDVDFLNHFKKNVVELANADGTSKVLLSADYQGRVMTSTATGDTGRSFGWINYDLIKSGAWKAQFNPVGGEERFWLGPEGGQYALYFNAGDSFTFANWQVPAIIDTVSYTILRASKSEAVFSKQASIRNYSGTPFDIHIERTVRLLDKAAIETTLKTALSQDVHFVGYETANRLQNAGPADWTKDRGLLSIWLLGMFTPTPQTVVIIPFVPLPGARNFITDNYFGTMPPDRLQVEDSVLTFTCDGRHRSKIGLAPDIAKPMAASFDFENNVLTLVIPEVHKGAPYVASKWELQREPYKGDVINSYNDGPLEDGTQMGPFYEIESSSPALALKRGEAATYTQTTIHLQGPYQSLRELAKAVLHVDLDVVKK